MSSEKEEDVKIDNHQIYIQLSKSNIDKAIYNNNYKKAFSLLIMVLERLNNEEKVEFINYYSTRLHSMLIGISPLNDHRF